MVSYFVDFKRRSMPGRWGTGCGYILQRKKKKGKNN